MKGIVVDTTGLARTSLGVSFLSEDSAGCFMTCTVSPFKMIHTRLMNQPDDANIYNNALDCFIKTIKNDFPLTLWRGFMPIWSRFMQTTTLHLILFKHVQNSMCMSYF